MLGPLSSAATNLDSKELQFKYHPNLAKGNSGAGLEREIKLKDTKRTWPIGQPQGVVRWRAATKDESFVPISSTFHPPLVHLLKMAAY